MNEKELQALKQVMEWIDCLELRGQTMNDNEYFNLSAKFWVVFAGVAKIHDLTSQQIAQMAAVK